MDLFSTGRCVDLLAEDGAIDSGRVELAPGQVRCLSATERDVERLQALLSGGALGEPEQVLAQRVAALETELALSFGRGGDGDLLADPERYCATAAGGDVCPMARWNWEHDANRVVVVPAGWGLIVRAPERFLVTISQAGRVVYTGESLPQAGRGEFALVTLAGTGEHEIEVVLFATSGIERRDGKFYRSPRIDEVEVTYDGDQQQYALCSNDRGAMSYVRGAWGEVRSQYDALLAANLHDSFPVDRRMLLVRCRAWVVYRDYSRELNIDCQSSFKMSGKNSVEWSFEVPVGGGQCVGIRAESQLVDGENKVRLRFTREGVESHGLAGEKAVRLVVRPDVDDRGFHEKTKAFSGPSRPGPLPARLARRASASPPTATPSRWPASKGSSSSSRSGSTTWPPGGRQPRARRLERSVQPGVLRVFPRRWRRARTLRRGCRRTPGGLELCLGR